MKKFSSTLDTQALGALPFARYEGDPHLVVDNACTPQEATPSSVIFLENEQLFEAVRDSQAGLIITKQEFADQLQGRNLLITDKPYFAMMMIVEKWLALEAPKEAGIHETAIIASDAQIGKTVRVESGVTIGSGSVIGDGCIIETGCVIGDNVKIGASSHLYPKVVVYDDCEIGKQVVIHSGAIIGADGFGFALIDGVQRKIPQIGNVIIKDYVEIGANSCVDRAALGSTIIGEGTKLDNLVQIGHNCVVGKGCILCAQVGLAGSTIVEDYVYLAGQVGVAGHLTVGEKAMVGAQSGVANSVPAGTKFFGTPAIDANLMKRILATQKHLPEIYRQYLALQKEKKHQE
ncbi:MAG: UDP-3-O-(3-hydroxymyristoyl)glucosamine N-acyltransferase [Candidatus Cloacimonadaceae bacterium]|jgi:UDP-3-O-[3-hydroxymyristoyl] glucosamine N-acyltransferase